MDQHVAHYSKWNTDAEQQYWWYELHQLWWDCEDAAVGGRDPRLNVAQKAVERALCEARNGRLLCAQYQAAVAAVSAALEGE